LAEEIPSGSKALFGFLEMVALAFAFEGVSALLNGRPWTIGASSLLFAALFFLIGVRIVWIKGVIVSVNWGFWLKWINRGLLLVAILAGVFVYYEWRLLEVDWGRTTAEFSRLFGHAQPPTSEPGLPQPDKPIPSNEAPRGSVDWHDKENWRQYLRVGMTKSEVRQLFGEPEHVSAESEMELWDYGSGEITFAGGTLYSWSEPED
jgi:hypothetical protein